ncbi:hypothetical protein Lal_00022160 [Lupinus albus]|nr:hypothetical protein Lal_00022160 [Lupinus albus]
MLNYPCWSDSKENGNGEIRIPNPCLLYSRRQCSQGGGSGGVNSLDSRRREDITRKSLFGFGVGSALRSKTMAWFDSLNPFPFHGTTNNPRAETVLGSRSMVVSRESKGGDGKGVSHGMFVSRLVKGKIQGDIGEK